MADFNYFLDKTSYSWLNALLWGNFVGHCKKAGQGSLGDRIVHVLIAAIEFLPIISQISSICEKLIIDNFSSTISSPKAPSLTDKRVSIETSKEKHKKFPTPPSLIDNESESLEKNIDLGHARCYLFAQDDQRFRFFVLLKRTQYQFFFSSISFKP